MKEWRGAGWLVAGAGTGIIIYLLAPILTPFLVATLLAYLGNPPVERLTARGLPRTAAVVLVFFIIVILLLLVPVVVFPLLERQVVLLIQRWPDYLDTLQARIIPWLQAHAGIAAQPLDLGIIKKALIEQWQQAGGIAAQAALAVTQSGLALLQWLINLILIPVVTFYLLRDWDTLRLRVTALLPRTIEPAVTRMVRECDEVLATFLRGQIWVMLALGVIYSVGLWLAGLDLAFIIGMSAGVISFVPYLGLIVGVLAGGIAALAQFHDLTHLLAVAAVFVVGQLIEGLVLTPWLVGDRIGLHPVAVIFAVMAGGQLFGFVGVLLALPAAAVIAVLLRHFHQRYIRSELYGMDDDSSGPG